MPPSQALYFIGDLSKEDAAELVRLMRTTSGPVLESGAGGSTHLLAQTSDDRELWSIETDPTWLHRCRERGRLVGAPMDRVRFVSWGPGEPLPGPAKVGLAFCDGRDELRLAFCACVWPRLVLGGVLAIHDALRDFDAGVILSFLAGAWADVTSLEVGRGGSNLAVLVKGLPQRYRDWRAVEDLAPWKWGGEDPPKEASSEDIMAKLAQRVSRWPT